MITMGSDKLDREVAKRLKLLRLAKRTNVSHACKEMGYSRDTFYRLKKRYKRDGKAGLRPTSRRVPRPERRVPPQVERVILAMTSRNPCWGRERVARTYGHISASGVYIVWRRNNLTTRKRRGCDDPIEPKTKKAVIPKATEEEIRCPFCRRSSGVPPSCARNAGSLSRASSE
jgi:transposase